MWEACNQRHELIDALSGQAESRGCLCICFDRFLFENPEVFLSFQDGILPGLNVLMALPASGTDLCDSGEFLGFRSSDEKAALTVSSRVIRSKFAESFR